MRTKENLDYPGEPRLHDNRAMDKAVRVTTLAELRSGGNTELRHWLARPAAERIAAVESLRRQYLADTGRPDVEPRLQRVCRITRRRAR